ncbi:hypothetical protein Tco_0535825 [Tanacetum coccineum]
MANLSSADPVYDEAGPSYDSEVLSEVQAHDHYQDAVCDHHEEHEMHDYVKDNAVPVVQNKASKVPNDAYVMIDNDLHESDVTPVSHTHRNTVANNLLNAELATYKEQVELYERRARKYASDVELFPPRNRNNREVHLVYLRHLKESVDTLRDIVEEAKAERPLDRSLEFACRTTHKHVEPRYTQKSNVPVPPSTGVSSCTDASGSQPRSILKKHRIPPAKSDSLKKVEDHSRIIRSSLRTTNRVDSSISSKRTVVQMSFGIWTLAAKHMTGDRSRLMNFVKKFIGTVRFGNDHFGAIMGYGDYVIGDSVISRVYYVEGLGHNLFSVGQFCDSDLEVAFRKHSCYVRDTEGVELLKGSRGSNLYTISVEDMMKSSPICLLSKASKNKSCVDLGKLQSTTDIGIFFGYAPNRKGYRIYNKRTRQIMETIHITFDELTEQLAPVQFSSGPAPNLLTLGPISSGLVPNPALAIPYAPPTNKELEMLFQPMFDEYFNPPGIRQNPTPNVAQDPVIPTGPSVSIAIDLDAPLGSHTSSPLDHHSSSVHHGLAGEPYSDVNPFAAGDPEPFFNVFAPDYNSEASSYGEINIPESSQSTQHHEHIRK